jgi:hypothetical protein
MNEATTFFNSLDTGLVAITATQDSIFDFSLAFAKFKRWLIVLKRQKSYHEKLF